MKGDYHFSYTMQLLTRTGQQTLFGEAVFEGIERPTRLALDGLRREIMSANRAEGSIVGDVVILNIFRLGDVDGEPNGEG